MASRRAARAVHVDRAGVGLGAAKVEEVMKREQVVGERVGDTVAVDIHAVGEGLRKMPMGRPSWRLAVPGNDEVTGGVHCDRRRGIW